MDKPWKVIVAFVGVFLFGSVFGGLLALRFDQRAAAPRRAAPPLQAQGAPLPGILRHFADRLDLTAEQREKIRPMVERAEEDFRRIRQTSLRDTGVILKRLQEDFSSELTPEQRKKLEKMQERQKEMLREERGDRPGLPPMRDKPGGRRAGPFKDAPPKDEPAPAKPATQAPGN